MSLSPLTFTGVSTYSNDLQTVLNRAVSIASLPLKKLQNDDANVLQKKTTLSGMTGPLTDLGNAVAALGSIASHSAVAASSSNPLKVSVVNTGANSSASYSITDITSVAQAASETSITGYADSTATPVSANGAMRLIVGAKHFDFTLATNNLLTLRDQINAQGAGVTASILTTGATNYLSLSANASGQQTLQLMDDPLGANTNIITANNQGANAIFKLNGISINRSSNTVNDIIGGLTFSILDKTSAGESINLTLATDRGQLSSAIQTFVRAYNAAAANVGQQVGPNAGLLSGDFLVREVQNDLRSLGAYQASGAVSSLSDMGITFADTGQISFDSVKFNQLSDAQISGAFHFFGSASTGFGALASKFTQLTDPVTGLIQVQLNSYDSTDRRLQKSIADTTDRIALMQKTISAKLQLADALLAQLQSQQNAITASIQAANFATFGKQSQ